MLTYQVRPRVFRFTSGEAPTFPAQGEICIHLQPRQPFGTAAGGGHTAVQGVAASVLFNANSGEHTIESKEPLSPLVVNITESSRKLRLAGNTFSVSEQFGSLRAMEELLESVYFVLPTLLNVSFADPPYIERVDGKVGSTIFRWELAEWRMEFRTTTQEQQQGNFAKAWEQMGILSEPHRRRLVAGLHYFHVGCRLARVGSTAGEFVAEVVLNLAKSLEVLFPPPKAGQSRDAARAGLSTLGFSADLIERDFIPAMTLRDTIDVGHVQLGLFTMDQLKTIHAFTERAERAFREMFDRLLRRVELGEADVTPHELGPPSDEAVKLIARPKSCTGGGAG